MNERMINNLKDKLNQGLVAGLLTQEKCDKLMSLVEQGKFDEFKNIVRADLKESIAIKEEAEKQLEELEKELEKSKTLQVTSWGETYDVMIRTSSYSNNGNLYVGLMCKIVEDYGEWYEPYADVTVNVRKLDENCGAVDVNNFPEVENFITDNGLGEFTGDYEFSGFCAYPVYRFNMDRIKLLEM